jgi:hypothetical protein
VARGIDLSSLTRAERQILAAAVLQYVNGFVPWWYQAVTAHGTTRYNAGLTGWGVIAVVAAGLAAIAVLARASIWPEPAPRMDGIVYACLGAVPMIGLAVDAASRDGDWIGSWVAIALAAALVAAGLQRRQERRTGWA